MTRLLAPSLDLLDGYAAALRAGWSPNTTRDVTQEELAAIAEDAPKHLSILRGETPGIIRLTDGREVERLPGFTRWIWDDDFCGAINLRHQPGTEQLPPYVSGHVGYAIVPWKRRQGHATRALALLLPLARVLGMSHLLITCDADNDISRRVIESNGGAFAGTDPNAERPEIAKLLFWVPTSPDISSEAAPR